MAKSKGESREGRVARAGKGKGNGGRVTRVRVTEGAREGWRDQAKSRECGNEREKMGIGRIGREEQER